MTLSFVSPIFQHWAAKIISTDWKGIEIGVTGGKFVGKLSEEGDEEAESKGHSKRWRQGALRGREP